MQIDGGYAKFNISVVNELTLETMIGMFKVKCFLSPIDMIKVDRLDRELIGSVSPLMADTTVKSLSLALSQLAFRVVESPVWWRVNSETNLESEIHGSHLTTSIVAEVFNQAIECEEAFRKQKQSEFEANQKKLAQAFKNMDFNAPKADTAATLPETEKDAQNQNIDVTEGSDENPIKKRNSRKK